MNAPISSLLICTTISLLIECNAVARTFWTTYIQAGMRISRSFPIDLACFWNAILFCFVLLCYRIRIPIALVHVALFPTMNLGGCRLLCGLVFCISSIALLSGVITFENRETSPFSSFSTASVTMTLASGLTLEKRDQRLSSRTKDVSNPKHISGCYG